MFRGQLPKAPAARPLGARLVSEAFAHLRDSQAVILRKLLLTLALVGALAGCDTSQASMRTVGIQVQGFPSGYTFSYVLDLGGQTAQGGVSAPNSLPFRIHAGSFVSFKITSWNGPQSVMCTITSDGNVVSTATASEGRAATCAGKV